jgi:hypothetical protein
MAAGRRSKSALAVPDYLERLGASIIVEHADCRVLSARDNVLFPTVPADELRRECNEAVHKTVAYFTGNVAASDITMAARNIEEVAFGAVLASLYCYNIWRHNDGRPKTEPLLMHDEDLMHVQTRDYCRDYCRKTFSQDYARYAAALTGMSIEAFKDYERGRDEYIDRR